MVNNFVSGLILMLERPLQPGDAVDVGGTTGHVREIGMRATTIRTYEGADVIVPNGMLLSEKLTNWTLRDFSRRIGIDLGVGCDADPEQVLALLLKVVRETPGVASLPEADVTFNGFGDSALRFSVHAWTHDIEQGGAIRSQLLVRIHGALREAGIEVPFPQQDLRLRSIDDAAAEQLRAARQPTPPTPTPNDARDG